MPRAFRRTSASARRTKPPWRRCTSPICTWRARARGGDARALAAFEQRYLAEVPLFLSGVERGPRVVDEVTQLVRERLFVGERSKILEYSGRGTLGSWVRVVTLRVASNGRRGRGAERHAPLDEANDAPAVLLAVDPELAIIKTRYKGEFNEALRAAFADLSPRDRLVFRMPSSTA